MTVAVDTLGVVGIPWRRAPLAAVRTLVVVRRHVAEEWLSGPQVAVILEVTRATVLRIPREDLPYEETPGGQVRGGRRRYKPADVEAYRRLRAGGVERTERLERQLHEVRVEVRELGSCLERAQDRLGEALDRIAFLERAAVQGQVERQQLLARLERDAQSRELT